MPDNKGFDIVAPYFCILYTFPSSFFISLFHSLNYIIHFFSFFLLHWDFKRNAATINFNIKVLDMYH